MYSPLRTMRPLKCKRYETKAIFQYILKLAITPPSWTQLSAATNWSVLQQATRGIQATTPPTCQERAQPNMACTRARVQFLKRNGFSAQRQRARSRTEFHHLYSLGWYQSDACHTCRRLQTPSRKFQRAKHCFSKNAKLVFDHLIRTQRIRMSLLKSFLKLSFIFSKSSSCEVQGIKWEARARGREARCTREP